MATNTDWLVRLVRAGLSCEEAQYIDWVSQAASLERQALALDMEAHRTHDPVFIVQAEALRAQSRAILDDLTVLKAGIDAKRQILGVTGGQ